ncbi:hypothetical protein [Halomicrobium katesii]|uniref:hypothetical protein n=1 Tax=Halomicrobium katesii TaxID=437163 RepID=UPI000372E5CA|nr:hypothetical protein [Halomicrobium katesii]
MIGHKNALRLLVALLVVGSVIPAPAVAQSDNEYSHQYTDGPQKVVVDQSNISGDFTVTVSTNQATGAVGEKTLLQRVQLGPGAEQDIVYDNYGAYDNITLEVTVHGSGEPSFEQGEGAIKVPYNIGHTGGDRDLRCDEVDKLYSMTNPGVTITDCTPPVGNGPQHDQHGRRTDQARHLPVCSEREGFERGLPDHARQLPRGHQDAGSDHRQERLHPGAEQRQQ